jgi:hypothetical protein
MRSSDQGYVALIELLFCILAAGKCECLSVLRPSAERYVATCDRIFGLSFCLKTRFLVRRETLGYRYMCFVKAFFGITLPEITIL